MGGCQTLVMGKTHVLLPCLFVTLSCLTQPLSTSLMFCWVVGKLWLLVDGQLFSFGSGVAGLSVLCPHPHSTHDSMLALPVLFSSRACSLCRWCVLSPACSLTHHDFGSVGSSCSGIGRFWSRADISLVP